MRVTVTVTSLMLVATNVIAAQNIDVRSLCQPVVPRQPIRIEQSVMFYAINPPQLRSGDGWVRFLARPRPRGIALVSAADKDRGLRFADFGIYLNGSGKAFVREGDGTELEVGDYNLGDVFEIALHAGSVQYISNGRILHVSGKSITYPLEVEGCARPSAAEAEELTRLRSNARLEDPPQLKVPTREEMELESWFVSSDWSDAGRSNTPPVPQVDVDPNGVVGRPVLFDASASTDADGSIRVFRWDFGDEAAGGGERVKHTYDHAGTYLVKLTVVDNRLESAETTVTVIVEDAGTAQREAP